MYLKYFDYSLKWNDKKVLIRHAWRSFSYRLWYMYIHDIKSIIGPSVHCCITRQEVKNNQSGWVRLESWRPKQTYSCKKDNMSLRRYGFFRCPSCNAHWESSHTYKKSQYVEVIYLKYTCRSLLFFLFLPDTVTSYYLYNKTSWTWFQTLHVNY